jgi:hypothetical protein
LRAEIKDATPPAVPAAEMVLGIDGCFVKGTSRSRKTSLEIVLGQIEVPVRNGEVFAVVRHLDGLAKERVRPAMRRCGRTPDTDVAQSRSLAAIRQTLAIAPSAGQSHRGNCGPRTEQENDPKAVPLNPVAPVAAMEVGDDRRFRHLTSGRYNRATQRSVHFDPSHCQGVPMPVTLL